MKSFELIKSDSELLVRYIPSFNNDLISAKLGIEFNENGGLVKYREDELPHHLKHLRPSSSHGLTVRIKHVFIFSQADLVDGETTEDVFTFRLGKRYADCYLISGRVLDIQQDVLIGAEVNIGLNFFASGYEKRTSVFKMVSEMLNANERQIRIGTQDEGSIPIEEYEALLQEFPNTTRLKHYGEKTIESCLQDYLTFKKDYSSVFSKSFRNKGRKTRPTTSLSLEAIDSFRLEALSEAAGMLKQMINEGECIPERDWQEGLIGLLPLLFPQYVAVLSEVPIKDVITGKIRKIDYLLIDASGNADVIEIKKAFAKRHLLMAGKYRDNYVPARELRGGVFQIEKYIHLLLNWGNAGEKTLTEKYHDKLPDGVKIRFLSPRGLLIMGHCELNEEERRDFDLIRRQYSRVTDIITYDDLLDRLDRMIQSVSKGGMRLAQPGSQP